MGYCQGRVCGSIVAAILVQKLGVAADAIDGFHVRAPLKPVRVGELADLAE